MPKNRKYTKKPLATKKVDQSQDKEIAKIKKTIKAIEPEIKCFHGVYGAVNMDAATPRIFTLNGLVKGTNVNNRLGNKVRAKKLEISFQIYANSALIHDTLVRVMVVKEKTTLGSEIALAQLLGTAAPLTYAVRNYQTRDVSRFQVLRDTVLGIGPVSHPSAVGTVPLPQYPSLRDYKVNIPLNVMIDYARGNTGTFQDIDTNGIFIIFITDVFTVSSIAVRGECNYLFMDA